MEESERRWRMVLGDAEDPKNQEGMGDEDMEIDNVLTALYNSDREGNLGSSSPNVNRWLGDIRKYFPGQMVELMQRDAIEILGLEKMLLEPELLKSLKIDVHLVATLISLQDVIPDQTRETARQVVKKLTDELIKKLKEPMRQSIRGALNRAIRNYRPRKNEIDWNKTILRNLKNYQPKYKTIIPEKFIGFGFKRSALKHVILLVDQSASMSGSVVYASILGAVLASVPAITTKMVLFDTAIADVTDQLHDPVDLLFGAQLGGGTDINQAMAYVQTIIAKPKDTIVFLISDLYEGGDEAEMLARWQQLINDGVQMISLLALDDQGSPDYDKEMAGAVAKLGSPAFACNPDIFPDLVAAAIQKKPMTQFLANKGLAHK